MLFIQRSAEGKEKQTNTKHTDMYIWEAWDDEMQEKKRQKSTDIHPTTGYYKWMKIFCKNILSQSIPPFESNSQSSFTERKNFVKENWKQEYLGKSFLVAPISSKGGFWYPSKHRSTNRFDVIFFIHSTKI